MYSQSSVFFVFFFFSSRRRHTRLQGDWSSDVCSSDLLRSSWAFPGAKKDSVAMTNARMAGPILRRLRAEAAKGVDSGPPRACSLTRGLQDAVGRSEEHTSELQSPCNLVCRLLLEKKKTTIDADMGD